MSTASTTVPVEGENSPEYMAIRSNYGDLKAVLDSNKGHASGKLFQADLITTMPSGNISGEDMVISVLQGMKVNAMKFYKLLAVLQSLSNHKDILERIHKAFLRKSINSIDSYYAQHIEKITTSVFTDAVKQKIPPNTKAISVECKCRLYIYTGVPVAIMIHDYQREQGVINHQGYRNTKCIYYCYLFLSHSLPNPTSSSRVRGNCP